MQRFVVMASTVAVTVAGALAFAAPFTDPVRQLHQEVEARVAAAPVPLPRGKAGKPFKALVKADARLDRASTSLADDVRSLERALKLLERFFAADPTLPAGMDAAIGGVDEAIREVRDAFALLVRRLPASKWKARAQKRLGGADRQLGKADTATSRARRARFLRRVLAKVLAGERMLASRGIEPPPPGPDGARSFKSGPIQITADGAHVWVVNPDNDSVTRIDTATDTVTEFALPAVDGPHHPRGLSVREDGSEVWVACHDADVVCVLDGADGSVLARIPLPWGSGPHSIALSRDQSRALVTLHRASAVAVLDTATRAVEAVLDNLQEAPLGIVWTEDGGGAWVTHLFAPEHPDLTRIEVTGGPPRAVGEARAFATDPRQSNKLTAPHDIAEGGYLTFRGHIAQIPSATGRREVWLPTQYNNIHEDRFSPDSTLQATLRHLDLDTWTVPNTNADKVILSAVHVHDPASNNSYDGPGWNAGVAGPVDIAFSADGAMAYVLMELSNEVVPVPTNTPAVKPAGAAPLPEIRVGDRPLGMAIAPSGGVIYVANHLTRDVSVVDTSAAIEIARIPVTPVTGEPLDEYVLEGARYFHTSADPRISAGEKASCASCHLSAEHDGRAWGFHTLSGRHGTRRTPSLNTLGLSIGPKDPATGFGQLHRSGDRDELQDFDETFRGETMGGTGFLGAQLQPALGAPNAGRDRDLDALAAYLLDLAPVSRSPYRAPDGSLTEAAQRGATFFVGAGARPADANCASCHVPATGFVDFRFHDVGSQRSGNERELNDTSNPARAAHLWKVNTPTLVGAWLTSPYEGTTTFAPSMIRLLENMATRTNHGLPGGLTGRQLADLEQFVLSIDGDMTAAEVANARDTDPPRVVRVQPVSPTRIDVWFDETLDSSSVGDVTNWTLDREGVGPVPITAALRDDRSGNKVTLTTSLAAGRYTLTPGTVLDAAATASGGAANALDQGDGANVHSFEVGASFTITLGSSADVNIPIYVHDSAMVGPNLSTWNHDHPSVFRDRNGRSAKGFVRFDWRQAFMDETGVTSAAAIEDVTVTVHSHGGAAQTIEMRRCLLDWLDPTTGGNFNSGADGAPTWRDHAHPDGRWNQAGAGKRTPGIDGASVADYDGVDDLANDPDSSAVMLQTDQPVVFTGIAVTAAYRFWFDNPSVDYGHALELAPGSTRNVSITGSEHDQARGAPTLTITYRP